MFLNMLCQNPREVCATPGEYIKQQFGILWSTAQSSSMMNGHAVVLIQRKHELSSQFAVLTSSKMIKACGHKINVPSSCSLAATYCATKYIYQVGQLGPLGHKLNLPKTNFTSMYLGGHCTISSSTK